MDTTTRTAGLSLGIAGFVNVAVIAAGLLGQARPSVEPRPAPPARVRATPAATSEAQPGTILRWSVPGTTRCGMAGRSWLAIQETCYYPIDLLQAPGITSVSRHGAGGVGRANVSIVARSFPDEPIALGDIPQAAPSPADLRRDAQDQAKVAQLWKRPDRPAQFALPLAVPASPLPPSQGFGARYIFNGKTDSTEIHNGADYALPAGTHVSAAADGRVVLAADLFFAGNAVFIDHGGGLTTMYFHLASLTVHPGQDVHKGEQIGTVGATGRVTGPHLHFGVRWHGARIDPALLFEDPARIPSVGP